MATQAEKLLRIEHENGTRYAVTEADYLHKKMIGDQTYQDAGYTVVSYEDGTPYGGDAEPTSYALTSAAPAIGEGGSDHTNIDGAALTDAQRRDAVIVGAMPEEEEEEAPAPRRSRASSTNNAAPAETPSAPATA